MNAIPLRTDDLLPDAVSLKGGLESHLLALQAAGDKARAKAHAASGKEHYVNCQFGLAIACFDQAAGLDAQNADHYYNRGLAYYAKGDLCRAIADFDMALSLGPEIADACFHRGSALRT